MIISRYIGAEILRPLVLSTTVLTAVFVAYTSARYLAQAVDGLLPSDIVATLIGLQAIIALEVLLPMALYLSIVVALGRMHTEQEMSALEACGIGRDRVLATVLGVSALLAIVIGALSVWARPWAFSETYWLRAKAESQFEIGQLEAGTFFVDQNGRRVIFVEATRGAGKTLRGIFVTSEHDGYRQVTWAESGMEVAAESGPNDEPAPLHLVLRNGHTYLLDDNGTDDVFVRFDELVLRAEQPGIADPGYRRRAASTAMLARSSDPHDVSEYQWRLSTPLATVLLSLIAVPLSRTPPRGGGRYAKIGIAVLIYIFYYNVTEVSKTWIEQERLPPMPGIWWVHITLACLLVALLRSPFRSQRTRRVKKHPQVI